MIRKMLIRSRSAPGKLRIVLLGIQLGLESWTSYRENLSPRAEAVLDTRKRLPSDHYREKVMDQKDSPAQERCCKV